MKDNYTYPAILDYSDKGFINIIFPSFPNLVTCVTQEHDVIRAAQDYLALTIKDYEDEGKTLPDENELFDLSEGQKLIYINLWMPYHRSKIKETYVKKTLTIPEWLDILAKNNNINFSSTLVAGLKRALNLQGSISDAAKLSLYAKHSDQSSESGGSKDL